MSPIQTADAAIPARVANPANPSDMRRRDQAWRQPVDAAGTIDTEGLPPFVKGDPPGVSGTHMTFQEGHQLQSTRTQAIKTSVKQLAGAPWRLDT